MANFSGYLFKAVRAQTPFPMKYILESSWESTPNQREELKAYRDDNSRNLTRITAGGKKSIFSFDTRPKLRLADKKAILKYFTDNEITTEDHVQRKIELQFWDDENSEYKTGWFYRTNMPFKIIKITDDDIIYDSMHLDFIEY